MMTRVSGTTPTTQSMMAIIMMRVYGMIIQKKTKKTKMEMMTTMDNKTRKMRRRKKMTLRLI